MDTKASGLSRLLAIAAAPVPATSNAQRIGPVDHPASGAGGILTLFSTGIYAIDQGGVIRSCPQDWAQDRAAELQSS